MLTSLKIEAARRHALRVARMHQVFALAGLVARHALGKPSRLTGEDVTRAYREMVRANNDGGQKNEV